MTKRATFVVLAAVASFTLMACGEDSGEKCTPGTEGCTCIEGTSCITGLSCLSNRCVDPNKKPVGADCQSDSECQSGNCASTTVEGITVQQCAPGAVQPDGGGVPTGSCKIGSSTVESLHFGCDGKKLYECVNGATTLKKDCSSCYYIGSGTGSKYATRCKPYLISEIPDPWPADQKQSYRGPGCYYGYDVICGPYQ